MKYGRPHTLPVATQVPRRHEYPPAQARPQAPHDSFAQRFVSHPFEGSPSQSSYPALQAPCVQLPAVQTGVAFCTKQRRKQAPQLSMSLDVSRQVLPQRVKPALHEKSQRVPSQVAVPRSGAVHGVQLEPHDAMLEFETHALPQRWNPALQMKAQAPPAQLAVPFTGDVQRVSQRPQVAGAARSASQPLEGSPSQSAKPARQRKPQRIPSQVLSAFAAVGHGEHEVPQPMVEVVEMHALPQRWSPALQAKSHVPPAHVGEEPIGPAGQGVQRLPHVLGSSSATQRPSQRWVPVPHDAVQMPAVQVARPPTGTAHA